MYAQDFIEALKKHGGPRGVPAGTIFALSKKFVEMPPEAIAELLDSPIFEVRAGGFSIIDKQAALKKTTPERIKELYEVYIKRTNAIDDWRLVDVSCRYTMGRYLIDKPRTVLYGLAESKSVWERRLAIVSTWYFIRANDTTDTFGIAGKLLKDPEETIHKAVGWMLREAGNKNEAGLCDFLDKHASAMPRVMLRSAIERLSAEQKRRYLSL
ncbi:MAG TPA: DNA alkylation repair protein [Candidatus Saccharimonadales bacterium]|nr:DNA alkylation repair protein [Candidatus Saccharimonadales bacterium]